MKRKTVSLCMIARDEEAGIGRAIKSALALADEIIVVDTGSCDNTRIIAEGYGARVIDHPWRDDFAAARNAALAAAACDWILILDCDEHLQSVRPLEFQRLLDDPAAAGYRVRLARLQTGERTAAVAPAVRLFRNHPEVRFRYPVHEQIVPSLAHHAQQADLLILDSPLIVIHDPGGPEQSAHKRERNLRLLRQAVNEQPAEPYFAYLLGSETLLRLEEEILPVAGLQVSLRHLEAAWRKLSSWPTEIRRQVLYGPALARDLAAARLALGRAREAAAVASAARGDWGDNPCLCLVAIRAQLACLAERHDTRRRKALQAGIRRDLVILGELLAAERSDNGSRLAGQLLNCQGELALLEGDIAGAAEAFEQALNLHQDQSAAWVGLAECARLAGDRMRALRLYLRAVTVSEWNVRAWERGGSLMEELGFHDNAKSWRARVNERFPERLRAGAPAGKAAGSPAVPAPALCR